VTSSAGIEPDRVPADAASAEAAMDVGLARNAEANNYLDWLADLCEPHLGERCLELGSGHGDLTERFVRPGRRIDATDVSTTFLEILRQKFAAVDDVSVLELDVTGLDARGTYDSIVMANVLEHIEDDADALRRLHEALTPGGRLVVYVPAFMLLYSRFDREIGHYRRYRRPQLRSLFRDAGFRVVDDRYVNSLGAPGWFVYCRLLGRKSSDQVTVSTCDRVVVPLVRKMEDRVPPPFGLSLLVVGERV
jgi:SAM-dependent methyltransferase